MPNGFHGSDVEWARIETPLRALDARLEDFARRHQMRVGRNHHNWPERSLRWGVDITRLIQVYLEDSKALSWSVWVCASQDRRRKRYWKNEYLKRGAPLGEIADSFEALLDEARELAESWRASDLEFATELEA